MRYYNLRQNCNNVKWINPKNSTNDEFACTLMLQNMSNDIPRCHEEHNDAGGACETDIIYQLRDLTNSEMQGGIHCNLSQMLVEQVTYEYAEKGKYPHEVEKVNPAFISQHNYPPVTEEKWG
ncbi:hypothetical protein PRtIB026_A20430 [Pseudomonas sp. RtIB026]|nr:hypothetical protein PRtIB026_A20430 [Pseudomonas sp. RtIB026]